MNTRLILITTAGACLWLPDAHAGERNGGDPGATAVKIPADTLSSGGGTSRAGSGANAITVTASMGGIIATVAAAPATSVQQGYIPQILPPRLYDIWASQNIPPGQDATFTGDWNGDGIINGVAYLFGNTPVSTSGKGRITAPSLIPPDVDIYLDRSSNLETWALARVRWVNGAPPTFVSPNFTIVAGEVVDTSTIVGGKAFYRYRVVQR